MSDKRLAYVTTIAALTPIEGKDRIVMASFTDNGWRVIVQKDQFAIGDQAVYIETDAVLPMWPEFSFLESRCWSKKWNGLRIRTMKMGGVYSEGIAFRLDAVKKMIAENTGVKTINADDLTEALKIRRVEDEVLDRPTNSSPKGFLAKLIWKLFGINISQKRWGFVTIDFPHYLIKTDETQAQSIPNLFEKMKGLSVIVTEKMDGQSLTMAYKDGIFTISTRNRTIYRQKIAKAIRELNPKKAESLRNVSTHAMLAAKYDIPRRLAAKKTFVALQGECVGPGIQKNRLGLKDYDWFVFNRYDIYTGYYESMKRLAMWCEAEKVPMVKTLDIRNFEWENIEQLEEYASQFDYDNGHPAEGVVIRGYGDGCYMDSAFERMHAMLSFKCISKRFRLATQKED